MGHVTRFLPSWSSRSIRSSQSLHICIRPACHNGGIKAHIHPQPHKAPMMNSQNNHKCTALLQAAIPARRAIFPLPRRPWPCAPPQRSRRRGAALNTSQPRRRLPRRLARRLPRRLLRRPTQQLPENRLPENRLLKKKAPAQESSSSKPTRRSARGSDVAAREKQERREARRHKAHDSERTSTRRATASRRGSRTSSQNTTEVRAGGASLARGAADSARGAADSARVHGVPLRHRARPAKRSAPR